VLIVTLALKTLLSISQNGINQITLKKQIGNHLNQDIINASISLSSFPFSGCFKYTIYKSIGWTNSQVSETGLVETRGTTRDIEITAKL
jgi:hypothetical protein